MDLDSALAALRSLAKPGRIEGNRRVSAGNSLSLGVPVPEVRRLAKRIGHDHLLAELLWQTRISEARQLAAMVEDPALVTEAQMERWAADFDCWDVCDGVCWLFGETPFAWRKAAEWARRDEEFVRRAGFSLMAYLALHDKNAPDARFLPLLDLVREQAGDSRNFVKKAVNWALRQIGKRNLALNAAAIATAEAIRAGGTRSGRWVAADALRELRGDAVQARLRERADDPRRQPLR
ncbi:MAG: DNA alkylation repair protein [Chloroflexi bacterium]|nr:DNA alkylation repair protein [Chloroflexota bacterium]